MVEQRPPNPLVAVRFCENGPSMICTTCKLTDYIERSIYDDWEQKLTCKCGHRESHSVIKDLMPYMKNGKRDYKRQAEWNAKPENVAKRVKNNAARREAIRKGLAKKGDGTDVDHKIPLSKGGSNSAGNLRVIPSSKNRSFSRNSDSSVKSQTSKRERRKR